MLESTSKNTKMIVVGVIVVAALLMILLVPFMSFNMVNPIVGYQQERIEQFKDRGKSIMAFIDPDHLAGEFLLPLLGHDERDRRDCFAGDCEAIAGWKRMGQRASAFVPVSSFDGRRIHDRALDELCRHQGRRLSSGSDHYDNRFDPIFHPLAG